MHLSTEKHEIFGRWKLIQKKVWTAERRVLIISEGTHHPRRVLKAVQDTAQGPLGQTLLREWLLLRHLHLSALPQAEELLTHGLFTAEPGPWLGFTQTWISGESLEERLLTRGPLSPVEGLNLAHELLLLLSRLEKARLVGLDLKPAHLFETPSGWKLIDVEQLAPPRPLGGPLLAGTPRYAAPELLEEQPASISTEFYALGRVLLEALTGTLPLPSASTLPALAAALRQLPPLSDLVLEPFQAQAPGLAKLLPALLAPHPNQRPLHVQAALELLGKTDTVAAELWLPPALTSLQPSPEGLRLAPGHEKPLKCLRELLHVKTAPASYGLRLDAPPGAGATRFLNDACVQLALEGVQVLRISAEPSPKPFFLAERLLKHLNPAWQASFQPSRAPLEELESQKWDVRAERLVVAIAQRLQQRPPRPPLLMVVDEPHQLDEPSQRVLAALLPMLMEVRLVLLLGHLPAQLTEGLTLLRRRWTQLPPLSLPPLSFEQARDVAESRLRTTLTMPTLQALYMAAEQQAGRLVLGLKYYHREGNIQHAVEYLQSAEGKVHSEGRRQTVTWHKVEEATQQGELLLAYGLAKALLEREKATPLRVEVLRRLAELSLALDMPKEALEWLGLLPEEALDLSSAQGCRTRVLYARAYKALGEAEQGLPWLKGLLESPAWLDLPVEERLTLQSLEVYLALSSKQLSLAEQRLPDLLSFSQQAEILSRAPSAWLGPCVLAVWLRLSGPLPQTAEEQQQLTDELLRLSEQAKRLDNRVQLTRVRSLLGAWAQHLQHPLARQWHEQEAQEAREAFDLPQEASALANLGRCLLTQHASEQAESALNRATVLFERLGDVVGQRRMLLMKTELYAHNQHPGLARQTLGEVFRLLDRQPHPTQQAWADFLDGLLRRREGITDQLYQRLHETFERLLAVREPELALACGLELLEHVVEVNRTEEGWILQPRLEELLARHGSAERRRRYHLALARLNGARLEVQEQRQVSPQDLEWLKQLEKLVEPSSNLQELAGSVAGTLERLLGGKVLVMLRGPTGIVQDHTGLSPEQLPALSKSIAEHVLNKGESLWIPDLTAAGMEGAYMRESQLGATLRQRQQYRSVVCMPVKHASRLVGALYVAHPRVGAVTEPLALQAIERVAHVTGQLLSWQDADLQAALEDDLPSLGLVGKSPAMQRLRRELLQMSHSDLKSLTVLFRGESGVGKSTLARILHELRHRTDAKAPFVSCDVRLVPESLLESELIGYAPNAGINGANPEGKPGWFEKANGGTLFIDEAQNLPLPYQERLLTLISEWQLQRLGGSHKISFSCDLVLGTSRDLRELAEQGLFLKALVNRVWVNPIVVPTLRARGPEDIRLLLEAEVRNVLGLSEKSQVHLSTFFQKDALMALQRYTWPGNVRELKNLMLNNVRVREHIKKRQPLGLELMEDLTLSALPSKLESRLSTLEELELLSPELTYEAFELEVIDPLRRRFAERMVTLHGNKRKAAEVLRVSRTTLDRLLHEGSE
ncbi:MAG: sigma 54-interacting transcriptional regulator [Myxococcota bacterium]